MIREHSEAVLRIHRAVIDEVQCCKRWNRDRIPTSRAVRLSDEL